MSMEGLDEMAKLMTSDEQTEEGMLDRLSNLPDEILHCIFSFLDTKHAVCASVLPKRWTTLWTCAPDLDFDRTNFHEHTSFTRFVLAVLQRRPPDSKIRRLSFIAGKIDQPLTDRVIDYAMSQDFDHFIFKSNYTRVNCERFYSPQTLGFSTLPSLHLQGCWFYRASSDAFFDFLASCPNLVNLHLHDCEFGSRYADGTIRSSLDDDLKISGAHLVSLTIEKVHFRKLEISGARLVNLSIEPPQCSKLEIYGPKVTFFSYKSSDQTAFSGINLPCLQQAEIETREQDEGKKAEYYRNSFILLQCLGNAQVVTLDAITIRGLSNIADVLVHQPSPRFKSLKFKFDPPIPI